MFAKSMTLSKADINRAFSAKEFAIVLQPQIEVADGAVVAVEAFVRWNHPSFGTMTPQLFLPFIDAHGESARLLDTVVRLGLGAASALTQAGRDWRVSINLGAADLQTGVAPDVINAALRESPVGADRLVVEAPEAALVGGEQLVRLALERLRAMGCGVALDSGGALPLETSETAPELFTEIKVGGAAILRFAEIARKVDGGRIARRLVFARKHGLRSVAVGVEQEKTLAALVKLGFGAVQGALIAKPVPLEALLAWDGGWRGEVESAPSAPAPARQRPRLVTVEAPAPAPAAKLVEQLTPAAGGFSFDEEIDDALDVDFDDETFGPVPVRAAEVEIEPDPSDDMMLDGEELHALSNAAPLHAGMIERPRKTAPQRVPVAAFVPAPDDFVDGDSEPAPEPVYDRPLALRVKAPPVKQGVFGKLGRLLRR